MQDNKDTFNEFINELIDKNDILDVVRGYVDLTRKGNSYWGRCPFHHEKTASFHVEERLKIYKCFGCGAAGNVIKFVQEIESVSFMEAVKILADRVGMKVPEFRHRKDDNLEEKKEKQERHYKLVAAAARYYNNELMHNAKMMEYLSSHGVDRSTIIKYGLGYSPSRQGIIGYLMSVGYDDSEIEEAGVSFTTKDDKYEDVMAGRIVCPHINTFGKVSGFAGSLRNGNTIYTRNTDIFRRENEVFGTHLLKSIKMAEGIDQLIVTSTPLNAVALRAKGYPKVVSVMGTEINSRQARALTRFTDKFTILFGGAENGLDKSYAGIDALMAEGASCKVASLIEDVNVFSIIEKKAFNKLETLIKKAKSLLEYQLDRVASRYDLKTREGKDEFIMESKGYIMSIKERSKQEPYISVLSKMAGVREDSIRKAFYEDADKSNKGVKRVTSKRGKVYNAMMSLLGLYEAGYPIGESLDEYLEGEYLEYYRAKSAGSEVELSAYFTDAEQDKLHEADVKDKNNAKIVSDCIKILEKDKRQKAQDAIIAKISEETDEDKRRALMTELQELMRG